MTLIMRNFAQSIGLINSQGRPIDKRGKFSGFKALLFYVHIFNDVNKILLYKLFSFLSNFINII